MDHYNLMLKSFSGEISEEEKEKLDRWLAESEENRRAFEEVRLIWEASGEDSVEVTDEETNEELQKLLTRIEASRQNERTGLLERRISYYKSAAAVLLLLLLGAVVFLYVNRPEESTGTYLVFNDARQPFDLPDSSRVQLNRRSSLSYTQATQSREVRLLGEGYFEVRHNPERPFYVFTPLATIRVTGTAFNVRAYPDEDKTEVVVSGGSVEIFNKIDTVKVEAGFLAVVHDEMDTIRYDPHKNPNLLAWKTGKLAFKNSQVREVLSELERMYDVKFEVEEPAVLNRHFTGKFENLSLEETLELLTFSLGMSAEYLDIRRIRLSGRDRQ